jgi:rhodanese-related sulfurtransferase
MLEILDDEKIIKLDVRDKDEWLGISSSPYGIDFAPKKGRIPNAVWIEWYKFITEDMLSVKSLEIIQYELNKKDIKPTDKIVLYCFKGARLSNTYISLRKLGYKNIQIYFAGWNEWCRKENAPIINEIENTNNPILQENIMLKKKLDELNLKQANLIDFPKYNVQPTFAFNREGEICSANEAKKQQLPDITRYRDIFPDTDTLDIYNIIDNNQERETTVSNDTRYYSLKIRGSRDSNKILMYSFDTTEINTLNEPLDKKIQELEQSEAMFKLFVDVAPVLVNSFDKDGKCILLRYIFLLNQLKNPAINSTI